MTEYLEINHGKFTFRIPTDRLYTAEGMWVFAQGALARVGITDFVQQRSGDIAFAQVKPAGSVLQAGEDMAAVETIKVDITFGSPVSGKVVETNQDLQNAPEIINQDPYDAGWLALIQPVDWEKESMGLLSPTLYYAQVQRQIAQETS